MPSQTKYSQLAIEPSENIAVFASAGTGKTQLLVHRILKLLLNDVDPSHILAITFTRKAATEMRERLMNILENWAGIDDSKLELILKQLAHTYDHNSISKAKNLYEKLLFSDYDIRITTFHAFCQDILKRFAIHAGVPAGFNVAENTEDLKLEARSRLYKKAHARSDPTLTRMLFELLKHCGTVFNVNSVLDSFIDTKTDWWSYTENQDNPVEFAVSRVRQNFFSYNELHKNKGVRAGIIPALNQYYSYLELHAIPKNIKNCGLISAFVDDKENTQIEDSPEIVSIFLKKDNTLKVLKASKALEKSLGSKKMEDFINLHEELGSIIKHRLEFLKKEELVLFNQAWFYAGHQILKEYQQIKFRKHLLDFDDLEWYTYLLLRQHQNAPWIQYKLDQQIKHFLIDEFQDTNPTQWNLLYPLLEELASSVQQKNKSLFFVGDTKQSIYSFRRANPQLQITASEWAKKTLNAKLIKTDRSYRSSPVIIKFVNNIFNSSSAQPLIKGFIPHDAAQKNLWGHVQIDPLIVPGQKEAKPKNFRNPLLQPRMNISNDAYYSEGKAVSEKIKKLVSNITAISDEGQTRPIRYSDIVILARNRNHLAQFELALREHDIPYCGIDGGDFLDQLEIQDVLALLRYLIQPHNDLAIAQVLRSPCFGINDDELIKIALMDADSWHEKIKLFQNSSSTSLTGQAMAKINNWKKIANTIPVHDLLDRIFFEINIFERYKKSCSPIKQTQVHANLTRLLHLSLDIDAGRYSSIHSFIDALQKPNVINSSSMDLNIASSNENSVRIMTIHSAKGLEAPVVFLIDTAASPPNKVAYQPIINWARNTQHPEQFFIIGRRDSIDEKTELILNQQKERNWIEELNLLYVALTRAKQYLFISGVQEKKANHTSWYSVINKALENDSQDTETGIRLYTCGNIPSIYSTRAPKHTNKIKSNYDFSKPFAAFTQDEASLDQQNEKNSEMASYGSLVHKLFELMFKKRIRDPHSLKVETEIALAKSLDTKEFTAAFEEVNTCLENSDIKALFKHESGKILLNEIPVAVTYENKMHYQIIDCLVISKNMNWIIDFKTTPQITIETMYKKAAEYKKQISSYVAAVKTLFPKKEIRASILFTAIAAIYDYNLDELD